MSTYSQTLKKKTSLSRNRRIGDEQFLQNTSIQETIFGFLPAIPRFMIDLWRVTSCVLLLFIQNSSLETAYSAPLRIQHHDVCSSLQENIIISETVHVADEISVYQFKENVVSYQTLSLRTLYSAPQWNYHRYVFSDC